MQLFHILSRKSHHNLLRIWARSQGHIDVAVLHVLTQTLSDLKVELVGAGNLAVPRHLEGIYTSAELATVVSRQNAPHHVLGLPGSSGLP